MRVILLLAALGLAAPLAAQATPRDTVKVVFVCEHGSVKSLVAVQYFNRLARERGLPFAAISRGTHPDSAVPPAIRAGLLRDGFDVTSFKPRLFNAGDADGAAIVVAFDQNVATTVGHAAPIQRWDNLPALSQTYDAGRDSIRARVAQLVSLLATESRRKQP